MFIKDMPLTGSPMNKLKLNKIDKYMCADAFITNKAET